MTITIPERSLVILIGPSGSGKSTFARNRFKPTAILSSDSLRAMLCDDENDQTVSKEAFEILHLIADRRLANDRLTVIDATNIQPRARRPLIEIARRFDFRAVAIVFDLTEEECLAGNDARPDRRVDPDVIRNQIQQMRLSLDRLAEEGFHHRFTLSTRDAARLAELVISSS